MSKLLRIVELLIITFGLALDPGFAIDSEITPTSIESSQFSFQAQALSQPGMWLHRLTNQLAERRSTLYRESISRNETDSQLMQQLEESRYHGGLIEMISEDFRQGAQAVVLGEEHGGPFYDLLLEKMADHLIQTESLRKIFVEYGQDYIDEIIVPFLDECSALRVKDPVHHWNEHEREVELVHPHLLRMLLLARQKGLPILGFDVRASVDGAKTMRRFSVLQSQGRWEEIRALVEEVKRTSNRLPHAGGETDEAFRKNIVSALDLQNPDDKALIVVGWGHVNKNPTLAKLGALMAQTPGLRSKLVAFLRGSENENPENHLKNTLQRLGIESLMLKNAGSSPVSQIQVAKQQIIEPAFTSDSNEPGIPVNVSDFDQIAYLSDGEHLQTYIYRWTHPWRFLLKEAWLIATRHAIRRNPASGTHARPNLFASFAVESAA